MYKFSKRSYANLVGVRPELVAVAARALGYTPVDFGVIEGLRTIERQRQLVASGASQTMHSKHLTGHAIDVAAYVGGVLSWDWSLYEEIAVAMHRAADELGVPIEWGGDWVSLKDRQHFQLMSNFPSELSPWSNG